MFDSAATALDAHAALVDAGGADPGVWIKMESSPVFDKATRTATPGAVVEYHGVGLVFDYDFRTSGANTMGSSLIQAGDRQLYLSTFDVDGAPVATPIDGGKCTAPDGTLYTMHNVKNLAPAGVPILYEVTLRR